MKGCGRILNVPYAGLVRPTKRRRGDFVQRMAFETPMTTEESDAAAAAIGGHM